MSTAEILTNREYKYGWVSDIEADMIPRGLSEDTVRIISAKKDEPEWMLEFRLKAYRNWLKMDEPRRWPNLTFPQIDYQDMVWMKSIRNCCARLRSSGFLSLSRNNSPVSRWMRSLIQFPSLRPTKRS